MFGRKPDTAYYETLGVSKDSDNNVIKKAYRKLAMKWHPDKEQDVEKKGLAEQKFKELSEAYTVLSDPQKRQTYDQFGKEGLQQGGFDFGGISPQNIFENIFGGDPGFGGIPNVMFMGGGPGGMGFNFGQQAMKARPIVQKVRCTLEDIYNGVTKTVTVQRNLCNEGRLTQKTVGISVDIPRGAHNGENIVLQGKGNESVQGEPGDLIIIVETLEHPQLKRNGQHLHLEKSILLLEALTGLQFPLKSVSGEKIVVESKPGEIITNESVHVLRGLGLPLKNTPSECGDLYITYKIAFPEEISGDRRDILRKLLPGRTPLPDKILGYTKKILEVIDENGDMGEGDPSVDDERDATRDDHHGGGMQFDSPFMKMAGGGFPMPPGMMSGDIPGGGHPGMQGGVQCAQQ